MSVVPTPPHAPDASAAHTATSSESLPHWDMTPVFPAIESASFQIAFQELLAQIVALRELSDRLGVRATSSLAVDEQSVAAFEEVTRALNALSEMVRTIYAYLASFVSTNSRDDVAQSKLSELQQHLAELQKLRTRYEAWIGSFNVEQLVARSELAREHAFPLRKLAQLAHHQMGEGEEDLAATLNLSGGMAWVKLHSNVSSQLVVPVTISATEGPGGQAEHVERLPMSAVRGLAHDPNPAIRRAAYEAELKGWEQVAVPLAAALNGVKGQVGTLDRRRGWPDSLAPALFLNNIEGETLEAMQTACRESFPDFRRYFRAKARRLGHERLPWWELFAPLGGAEVRAWPWQDAAAFVVEQFGTYSGKLADLARRALREGWVDAEPRDGKSDGAFCVSVRRDESRVLLNFKPSFSSVSTLAHELGHAYHNINLADRTALQRETPMALAETASIFCQTIVTNAALSTVSGAEKLAILEDQLQDHSQVVVDIYSRFLFEQRVFERRRERDLTVRELNELMLEAQRETYGDGLDLEVLHPAMWEVKSHYYSTGRSYYNWPYTFGLLFGLGLYARYVQDPDSFRAGYDRLLSSTGLEPAADLADRFGIDIRSVAFWRSSLDVCRQEIAEFEQVTTA